MKVEVIKRKVTDIENKNMMDFYSKATKEDAGTKSWKQVRNSRLWEGFVGTVFGKPVSTDKGDLFDTRKEAKENALYFIEQVRKASLK